MPAEAQADFARQAAGLRGEAHSRQAGFAKVDKASVGYKKPPVGHRFKKGRSGNPNGRPRKQAAEPARHAQNDVDKLVLEEAYRLVCIREGDKVIKLSTIQAVVRSLGVTALKGDRRAQLAFRDLIETVETRKHESDKATFKGMLAYKDRCHADIARCKALGLEPPDLLPHPDDIKLDFRTGDIQFVGPIDEREKHLWDEAQVQKNKVLGTLVRFDDIIRLYPRKRKLTQPCYDYFEQLFLYMSYYVPDEKDRRHPSYNREDRRPLTQQQLRQMHQDVLRSLE